MAHNAIMIVAGQLGQPLLVAIGASFCSVAMIGYLLHSRITFATRRSWDGFMRYVFAMTANLPLSAILLWVFSSALAWPMVLAAPCASCCMIVANFVTSRWAILGRSGQTAART